MALLSTESNQSGSTAAGVRNQTLDKANAPEKAHNRDMSEAKIYALDA